jgi:hypothetical protein
MMNKDEWTEQSSGKIKNSCVTIIWESPNLPEIIIECHFTGPKTGIGRLQHNEVKNRKCSN